MNDPNKKANKFDLEERTALLGESIIDFCKLLPNGVINKPLINQIVRSGTSIGANYVEANGASSKKDFRNKIYTCKRECHETEHWLRMVAKANPSQRQRCQQLWQEAHELTLIFGKVISTLKIRD